MSSLQRRLARQLYRWHRLLGLSAALLFLLLAVTGMMLNHTDALGLDRHHVTFRPLLSWYGIKAPQQVRYFAAGSHYLSQWEERLLFDDKNLGNQTTGLRGAVASNGMIVVARDNQLMLLLEDGKLFDILNGQTDLPTPIQRIGLTADGAVVVDTGHGLFIGDRELAVWQATTVAVHEWSDTTTPPAKLREATENTYLGEGLPLERVIEDLHSGRLFTRHGPWLMDLVALILIFSTLSGLWLWWRNHFRPRRH